MKRNVPVQAERGADREVLAARVGGLGNPSARPSTSLGANGTLAKVLALAVLALCACEEKPPSEAPEQLCGRARGDGSIAVDGDSIYWVDVGAFGPHAFVEQKKGSAHRFPKSGGATKELASNLPWPRGLALDADNLYWASPSDGKVMKVDKAGGALSVVAETHGSPRDLAVDRDHVYWADVTGPIYKVDKSGGTPATIGTGHRPTRIAVDASNVFWLDGGTFKSGGLVNPDGSLVKAKKDGTGKVVLATGLREPGGLALDDAYVYWTDRSEGNLFRIEKDGGAPKLLAAQQWDASQIAVDGEHLYWTVGERIYRMRKSGGKPVVWARGALAIGGIALDARRIFWLDGQGSVSALPK